MSWWIVQCPDLDCSRYMLVSAGTKRKKCPYCNRSFKVDDNFIKSCDTQEEARKYVKFYNSK